MPLETLKICKDGAQLFSAAISTTELRDLEIALAGQPRDHAGVRLHNIPQLRPFLALSGPIGKIAASTLGAECLPVRAVLFDKSAETNWSLGWHQDRTIAVQERIDVSGFRPVEPEEQNGRRRAALRVACRYADTARPSRSGTRIKRAAIDRTRITQSRQNPLV